MNIFATSQSPIKSAQALDDKRVNKMILESAQMLSTALGQHGVTDDAIYKLAHQHHPCTKWAAFNRSNFLWLLEHGFALAEERYYRGYNDHKSIRVLDLAWVLQGYIPAGDRTTFANCARRQDQNIDYTHVSPVTTAYKSYLIDRWSLDKLSPVWTRRGAPIWAQ